jgi:D-amino-acid dehydrogenase
MSKFQTQTAPVVVIGAGIIGACVAVSLLRDGHRVVIVDQEGPAAGASFGNAGAISPGSCVPLAAPGVLKDVPKWLLDKDGPLVVRANYVLQAMPWLLRFLASSKRERFEEICDGLFALHSVTHACYAPILEFANAAHLIQKSGALTVYESEAGFAKARAGWEARGRRGIQYQFLDTDDVQILVPALGRRIPHAVLQSDHGYVVDPKKLVETLVEAACAQGATFERGKVVDIAEKAGTMQVRLDSQREIAASQVVIAAGVSSKPLVRALGLAMPLERQRGYHLQLPDPGISLPLPVSFAGGKFYATPMESGIRLAGTVEFARADAAPDFTRAQRLGEIASRWLSGLQRDGATQWMGNRPCMPDTLPVIDRLQKNPNVILAFGHGHNGMTSASATGRIVSDLAAGRPPFMNIAPYRSNRFS